MKQWIILIIASILLLSGGIYEIKYLENSSNELLYDINYSKQSINQEDFSTAKEFYDILENKWENLKDEWSVFIDHDEIGNLEEELLRYKLNLELGQKDDAYMSIYELERLIKHIVEKQKIHIGNIF